MKIIQKYWAGLLIIVVFFALLYNMINENRKEKLLDNAKITFGFLIKEYHESIKFNNGIFYYFVHKKKYEMKYHGDFSFLQKGDTVLIKYAIEDPNVAVVEDRFYMKKYKHLKN